MDMKSEVKLLIARSMIAKNTGKTRLQVLSDQRQNIITLEEMMTKRGGWCLSVW
jgi:hypothetical protein